MSTIVQTSVPLATKAAQFDDVSRPRILIGHGNDGYWMESHNVRARLGELHSYVPTCHYITILTNTCKTIPNNVSWAG